MEQPQVPQEPSARRNISQVQVWQLLGSHVCKKVYEELTVAKMRSRFNYPYLWFPRQQGNNSRRIFGNQIPFKHTWEISVVCCLYLPSWIWFIGFLPSGETERSTLQMSINSYLCVFSGPTDIYQTPPQQRNSYQGCIHYVWKDVILSNSFLPRARFLINSILATDEIGSSNSFPFELQRKEVL